MKRKVLFLCTGNACRSQLAEALVNARLGATWEAVSAGTSPAGFVHPKVVSVLRELGIDHRGRSKHPDEFRKTPLDLVITVCDSAAGNCPHWLGQGKKVHMGFKDPIEAWGSDEVVTQAFRTTRDEIAAKIIPLLEEFTARHERDSKE